MRARLAIFTATLVAAAPAGAVVLPGAPPCPTILNPSPCLVFDTSKIGKFVLKARSEAQKAQAMLRTVEGYKRSGAAIGASLTKTVTGLQAIPPTLSRAALQPITTLEAEVHSRRYELPRAIEAAARRMTTQPGSRPMAKEQVARSTAATAYATALHAKSTHAASAAAAMQATSAAAAAATSARDDFAINSRVRLELLRQRLVGDTLLATYVQMRSAARARDQRPVAPLGQWTVTRPAITARTTNAGMTAWSNAFELQRLAGAASRISESATIVETLRDAQRDLSQLGQMSRAADRAQYDARLAIERMTGGAGAARLFARLEAIPEGYQSAIETGRTSAARLGQLRGIGAAERNAGVDPMTLVGTWADPMKDEDARAVTSQMAATGALGRLSKDNRARLGDLAVAYHGAALYADLIGSAARDAQSTFNQIERAIAATEGARGVDLDGDAWKLAIDRLDAAAAPLERALSQMPATTGSAIAADVVRNSRELDAAAAQN